MKFAFKRWLSALIDYVITGGVVSLFYFCANVFFLEGTSWKGELMLISALISILFFTCYIPTVQGQTIGQRLMKVKVVNKNNTKRTYLQNFLRECVLKFALGPVFLLFSIVYFFINNVFLLKDVNVEMPYDTLLKTKVLNMAS